MQKKIWAIVAILVGVVVLIGATGFDYFKPDGNVILDFIKENSDRSSIKLVRNDTVYANLNSDKMMPLASTVKILLAIEYAEQAATGKIDANELISLAELDKFYVKNTDGNAHPGWLKSIEKEIENDHVKLREVAKGMIKFSSNANTEWLSEKLGLDNINARLDNLGVKHHSKVYNIVSALFVGKELYPGLKGKELEGELRALKTEDYIKATSDIHQKLLTDTSYRKDLGDMNINIQKVWSDNLPASTTSDYVEIMQKINSRAFFDKSTHTYMDEVMEWIMDNPANSQWLEHCGMKGGSTAFVLTKAVYATDKNGNTTELAYFFNDLGPWENTKLQMNMNQFELNIFSDKAFIQKVRDELMN